MRALTILAVFLLLAACAGEPSDETELTPVTFADLPGWSYDQQSEPLQLFAQSCAVNQTRSNAFTTRQSDAIGESGRWREICQQAQQLGAADDAAARRFFEQYFTPFRVWTERYPQGLLTGYYLPLLQGSLIADETFRYPVYGLPAGYSRQMSLPERSQIEAGALKGRAPTLLYVDDPVMLFFTHIQGSGKVQLRDGQIVTIQYAGQNGHSYVGIGKLMQERELLDEVSMQSIRDYFYQHPGEAPGIMNENPSYIFFSLKTDEPTAKGALGISLTPLRSIAIDDDRATYGVPTYIATMHSNFHTQQEEPLQRLMVSQDTGGALHGPHRGDIFFGVGQDAEYAAGQQNARGDVFWLLPK